MAEVDVPSWLKSLPLAPEYHPTEAEFSDPIDYIFKIEQEAAQFGICKIVPPYLKAPKRVVFNNLNLSLANSQDAIATGDVPPVVGRNMCPARSMGGCVPASVVGLDAEPGGKAKFTTRRQQLGWNAKKVRAAGLVPQAVVHKLVWQSGETYTLDQFEAKAKIFARNRLGTSQEVGPLAVEALFWKTALEKAISIEYANDIPGSAFAEPREGSGHPRRRGGLDEGGAAPGELYGENGSGQEDDEKSGVDKDVGMSGDEGEALRGDGENGRGIGCKLSNSAWNMRKVARAPGSLLRFIPDEVPGVTSPMVYIGMLFSWFAWHVEDHELHSLNYLHTGAPKTWYAVPGDAAPALEEVVRVQGYGCQLNAQDAFARLGEKTTVMSPEVLVAAGVPCCRLVQNAGEYVVTFPRAYHLGFSHGFNCGEAANFATPGWLDVAREASVRRAVMKYLPMLSHQQLLYTLAVSLISRSLFDIACEKRSSRLKEKKRVGEEVVKSMFVNDVIQQNDMIGKLLDKGVARCLLVRDLKHYAPHAIMGISREEKQEEVIHESDALESPASERPIDIEVLPSTALVSMASKSLVEEHQEDTEAHEVNDINGTVAGEQGCGDNLVTSALPRDLSTLPCAACGILCYTGRAIVQPSENAAITFKPLHPHASGSGSHRGKGVINSVSGVLPGKADKKSADFHMLPNVEVQPLLELEGTTPDVYADALFEDQTEEPEVWTPELKECPTTYKDCSHDATMDAEIPQSGQASAISERDEYFPPEVAKAPPLVGNDGVTLNDVVGDVMEVAKENHEIIPGLDSAVSGDHIGQTTNSGATKCGLQRIELKPVANEALSSLQLLAAAYDGDSDIDEYDEIDHGNAGNNVGSHLTGPTMHTADLADLASGASPIAYSRLVSPSLNREINPRSPTSKDSKAVLMLSPSGSQTLALKGTNSSLVELSEEHLNSGIELDCCERVCNTPQETVRIVIEPSSFQPYDKTKNGETVARDEAKQKSAMSFGECVTCSLPHEDFFDSFEEGALKSVDNGTMELEISSEKNDIHVSCDENSKSCTFVTPESELESNEPAGVPCSSIVEAGSLLAEGSSVTTDSCSTKLGEAPDNCGSLVVVCATKHPHMNGVEEARGAVEPMPVESNAPNQLQILKGAARPRMLCLEHAVAAQRSLELRGGGTVIIICHSSFPKVEEQAKAAAAEVGVNRQWRSVPFQQAGDEEYKIITAAVEAEEERLAGGRDWVDQLELSIHGQSKSLSNDVEIPSSEESEEPGNRRIWKGRKEKTIIRQWCGKGWRADQLHPSLGGCRVQIDNTTTPANVCTSGVVSSHIENGRTRKITRPARLAEYTPDGRAPKGESHTKKSSNKRKILLEMSEDDFDEQNSEATPLRRGGSHDGFFTQVTLCGSSGDSLWREVPIASTDSLLLPLHLSGADMAEEKGRDDLLPFAPQPVFRSENGMHLIASEENISADLSLNNGESQVVGGFLQRGAKLKAQAKLQKLQNLCRELSTPVSVPCTTLTTPTRSAAWGKPSHRKIAAAKLVNRLKRRSATEFSGYSKKQRFAEAGEPKNRNLSLRRELGEGFTSDVLISENIMSIGDEEAKEDLLEDHNTPSGEDKELKIDNHSQTTAEEDEYHEPEKCDSGLQPVQDCNSKFLRDTDSSPNKNISPRGHYRVEDSPKDSHCPSDKTPNIDPIPISISMYCTESLPQGPSEQTTQVLGVPSAGTEPVSVPRRGRVRGKRIKSRHWKSCLQMPRSVLEEEGVSPTCDENHTSGDVSNDLLTLEPKLRSEGRDSGAQADPDFFPYPNCLTSSTTSVRRRRICTPGIAEWGADKDGNGDSAEGSADHSTVQHQDTKTKKRKIVQKPPNKRNEDLEGEFQCDMEGCIMAFDSIRDLQLHKKNLCTWKGCGKHFHMHKYLLQHRRVHLDDRPLKCPWKGCTQAFKWAWARTEHIRVHTGERPYKCLVSGCGQTFRFVSDFSRHKRNTGHRPT
ncbi:hypothetical protein M758_3G203900 [Ceratodon purpureus]|nr:hypothetical protein M758_3G203900 [Ceratodon purpureus]